MSEANRNFITLPEPDTSIKVGDIVKSYDFIFHGDTDDACFCIGKVESMDEKIEGCLRYKIKVNERIFGGERITENVEEYIFPPINGTRQMMGGTTRGVVKI